MARASRGDTNKKANSPFATRLSQLMNENPVTTQADLAKITDKTRQTVSQYVNGISEPGYDTLVKIADHFNVSLDYLLGRSNTRTLDTSIHAICSYTGLNEESVNTLHKFVDLANGVILYDEIYDDYVVYNFDAVCNFISFLDKNYPLFYRFRQQCKGHQEYVAQFNTLTLRESAILLCLNTFNSLKSQDNPENSCTLSCREAADYFRTAFCDRFNDYLKSKYPLDNPVAVIKSNHPSDKPSADTKED